MRRFRFPVLGLLAFAAIATACGAPPGPRGWAGARPIDVEQRDIVLAAHKSKLFAFPKEAANPIWQFPPRERDDYPISELSREVLTEAIDASGADEGAQSNIQPLVDDLHVQGPSIDTLKDAIDASTINDDAKDDLKRLVDGITDTEKDALTSVRGLYGDLAVSDDGTTAWVPTFGGWLFALDTDTGETRWVVDAGAAIVGGVALEPGAADDARIFFGTRDGDVFGVDAATGQRDWIFEADDEIWATPTIDGDALYVSTLAGTLYRLDLDGNRQWSFTDAGGGIAMQPVVLDGTVYAGAFDNKLYAIDAETGAERWNIEADNWFWSTPVVQDGVLYAGSLDGKVYAVDAESGEERWDFDTGAPVRGALAFANGGVIAGNREGRVYKLDPESGEAIAGSPIQVGQRIESNLTKDRDDRVYVVPRNPTLYVIETEDQLAAGSITLPQ